MLTVASFKPALAQDPSAAEGHGEAMAAQAAGMSALFALAAWVDLVQPIMDAALPALVSLLQHGHPQSRTNAAAALSKLTCEGWALVAEAVLPGLVNLLEVGLS